MGIPLSDDLRKLIDRPNFAHLATLMPDGSPHSAPVWIAREGDLLLIGTEATSIKGKNTLRDPRIAISVVDFRDPYIVAQMRGRVIERRPDPQLKYYDLLSQKYIGKPWPYRNEASPIVLVIEIAKAKYEKQPFEHTPQTQKERAGRCRGASIRPVCRLGESLITCTDRRTPQKIPAIRIFLDLKLGIPARRHV
jgi:PPOX class probable F420-dependent enzyme